MMPLSNLWKPTPKQMPWITFKNNWNQCGRTQGIPTGRDLWHSLISKGVQKRPNYKKVPTCLTVVPLALLEGLPVMVEGVVEGLRLELLMVMVLVEGLLRLAEGLPMERLLLLEEGLLLEGLLVLEDGLLPEGLRLELLMVMVLVEGLLRLAEGLPMERLLLVEEGLLLEGLLVLVEGLLHPYLPSHHKEVTLMCGNCKGQSSEMQQHMLPLMHHLPTTQHQHSQHRISVGPHMIVESRGPMCKWAVVWAMGW